MNLTRTELPKGWCKVMLIKVWAWSICQEKVVDVDSVLTNIEWLNKGPRGRWWQWTVAVWLAVRLFALVCACVRWFIFLRGACACGWTAKRFQGMWCIDFLTIHLCKLRVVLGGSPAAGSGHWAKQCTKGSGQSRNAESQAAHSPLFTFLLIKLACVIGLLRFTSDLLHTHVLASPPTNTADGLCVPHFTQWVLKR